MLVDALWISNVPLRYFAVGAFLSHLKYFYVICSAAGTTKPILCKEQAFWWTLPNRPSKNIHTKPTEWICRHTHTFTHSENIL